MPRPRKCRRVCNMPERQQFGPLDGQKGQVPVVVMTVDEYESIRWIDLEGLTQEECAKRMEVARTTVQSIYSSARKKIAECVVYGKKLHIHGGDYILCGDRNPGCGCGRCAKRMPHKE